LLAGAVLGLIAGCALPAFGAEADVPVFRDLVTSKWFESLGGALVILAVPGLLMHQLGGTGCGLLFLGVIFLVPAATAMAFGSEVVAQCIPYAAGGLAGTFLGGTSVGLVAFVASAVACEPGSEEPGSDIPLLPPQSAGRVLGWVAKGLVCAVVSISVAFGGFKVFKDRDVFGSKSKTPQDIKREKMAFQDGKRIGERYPEVALAGKLILVPIMFTFLSGLGYAAVLLAGGAGFLLWYVLHRCGAVRKPEVSAWTIESSAFCSCCGSVVGGLLLVVLGTPTARETWSEFVVPLGCVAFGGAVAGFIMSYYAPKPEMG
jgi:hypothetical protein